MGPSSLLGKENEKKLADHNKSMHAKYFPLKIGDARRIAYDFEQQLKLKHRFITKNRLTGYDLLPMFLSSNINNKLRKSKGILLLEPMP